MKCRECTAPAEFEGYCSECLGWFADHLNPIVPPATSSHVIRAARDDAAMRAETAPEYDIIRRYRAGDPMLPLSWFLLAMAAETATREAEKLTALLNATEEAEREWAKWETVQRWKAHNTTEIAQ